MSISVKTERALEELGLTGYEVKAYFALVGHGPLTAQDISRESGVPHSKIYDVLNSLEKKGWIEAEHSRPSRFFPRSPETALEAMRMRVERGRMENEAQVLAELSPIFEKRGAKEKNEIWIVRGEFNILTKVKETLEGCRKELMLAAPPMVDGLMNLANPVMTMLKEKGVRIMLMCAENANEAVLRGLSKWGDLRIRETMFGGGVISDGREVILLLSGDDGSSGSLAIWADHPGLAGFARNYFGYLWNDSKLYARA